MTTIKFPSPFGLVFLLTFITFEAFAQNKIYVNRNASGANDGTSWADAFQEIQPAINAANTGDSIWVAAGTYYPTLAVDIDNSGHTIFQEKTFYINKNITIHGQFQGNETLFSQRNKAHQTILSGDIGSPLDSTDNAFHVVYFDGTTANGTITNNTVLDGFIIEQGQASGTNFPHNVGAGIFNNGQGIGNECNPVLTNLFLHHNSASAQGGALYNDGSQGGICNPYLTQILFHSNTAQNGGAIFNNSNAGVVNISIHNSSFTNNTATHSGAGLYSSSTNSGRLDIVTMKTKFDNNSAYDGAVYYNHIATNSRLNIMVDSSFFEHNLSVNHGGVFCNQSSASNTTITINNSTFSNNNSSNLGGIFYNTNNNGAYSTINLSTNEFKNNRSNSSGGICYTTANQASRQDMFFTQNKVEYTTANGNGGVFFNNGDSSSIFQLEIIKNQFESNNASLGGIFYDMLTNNSSLDIQLKNNSITGNTAFNGAVSFLNTRSGSICNLLSVGNDYVFNQAINKGGVFFNQYNAATGNTTLVNDILHVNRSEHDGVFYHKGEANSALHTQIINCTFNENYASTGARSISSFAFSSVNTISISNSIFYHLGGALSQINTNGGQINLTHSLYNDNNPDGIVTLPFGVTGSNNIEGDPLFNNEPSGDLTLAALSPAIDIGNNDSIPSIFTVDNNGQPRIYNTIIDLGALETINNLYSEIRFLGHEQTSCNGLMDGEVSFKTLGATPPLKINGVTYLDPVFNTFSGLAAGTYQYNFEDSLGKTDTIYINITEPDPIVLSIEGFSNGRASVTASGGTAPYTYQWNDNNQQTSDVATGLTTGTYTVSVTDANGCMQTASVNISIISNTQTIKMDEANTLSIFPNPSNGEFQVVFNLASAQQIHPVLYNLQGQCVYKFPAKTGQDINYEVDLKQLPAGTYLLSTFINQKREHQFIVLN
ncbi:T9SS type A sorting domain-containing protein [Aureispira sp. CCB-QB1]|uniref:T9SS type A sorting domain-containing protein n=1 Tax=Aureispira sp. CCB-QB1 TaxID=1313421 RepID=UPI0006985B52|nr:T9SS type A sorting domain-containing protein [Aureispira sp. CCB-QB1]